MTTQAAISEVEHPSASLLRLEEALEVGRRLNEGLTAQLMPRSS